MSEAKRMEAWLRGEGMQLVDAMQHAYEAHDYDELAAVSVRLRRFLEALGPNGEAPTIDWSRFGR